MAEGLGANWTSGKAGDKLDSQTVNSIRIEADDLKVETENSSSWRVEKSVTWHQDDEKVFADLVLPPSTPLVIGQVYYLLVRTTFAMSANALSTALNVKCVAQQIRFLRTTTVQVAKAYDQVVGGFKQYVYNLVWRSVVRVATAGEDLNLYLHWTREYAEGERPIAVPSTVTGTAGGPVVLVPQWFYTHFVSLEPCEQISASVTPRRHAKLRLHLRP